MKFTMSFQNQGARLRKVALQITLILIGLQASAATPFQPVKYDAELLKAYAADPDAQTRDRDHAYAVVAAQTIKFYDDTVLYYMHEMNITETPVPVDVLNEYLNYFKMMPPSVLSDVAHARHNLPFATAVLQRVGSYQVLHGKKVTLMPPPNPGAGNPNVPVKTEMAPQNDSGTGPSFKEMNELHEKVDALTQQSKSDKVIQYVLMAIAGISLILAVLGLARR